MTRCPFCPVPPGSYCHAVRVPIFCDWAASGELGRQRVVYRSAVGDTHPAPPADTAPPPWSADAPPPQPPLPPVLPEPAGAWRDRIRTCLYRDPPGKGCGCQSSRCWAGRGLSGLVGDRDCYECLTQTEQPP